MIYRLFALITTLAIFLCGCAVDMPVASSTDNPDISSQAAAESSGENSAVEVSSEENSSEIIPYVKSPKEEELTDQYYEKYLASAAQTGVLSVTWENAEEIPADSLINFFLLEALYKKYPDGWFDILELPAKQVEKDIQSYFDVSSEHIRESYNYNAETNTFSFGYGIGATSYIVVTDAKQDENLLTLSYDFRDPIDQLFAHGSIIIKFVDKDFEYISCEYQKLI